MGNTRPPAITTLLFQRFYIGNGKKVSYCPTGAVVWSGANGAGREGRGSYITIVGAFNLGGVKGNDKSIVRLSPNGGASVYTPSLVTWLAAGATIPSIFKIDGIELVR